MTLVCYLDDSNDSNSSVATIGGYFGLVDQWILLEKSVETVLSNYGITLLHAKEFHDTKDEFSGWSQHKKFNFTSDIYKCVRQNSIIGIFCSVSKSSFKKYRLKNNKSSTQSPFSVTFSGICGFLVQNDLVQKDGILFCIELGNKNNSGIEKLYHDIHNNPDFIGLFKGFSQIGKHDCRAIQLADFLVFHARRWSSNQNRYSPALFVPGTRIAKLVMAVTLHFDLIITENNGDLEMRRMTDTRARSKWQIRSSADEG
jgi:hypothetical protein